jgi:hypothetical protein
LILNQVNRLFQINRQQFHHIDLVVFFLVNIYAKISNRYHEKQPFFFNELKSQKVFFFLKNFTLSFILSFKNILIIEIVTSKNFG